MAEVVISRDFAAPQQRVWDVLVDWDVHDRWMLLTKATGGHGVGEPVRAFTGIGRLGFLDTMTITVWEPPHRAVVRHTGRVVRGSGAFEVQDLAADRSRVVWSEWIDLPFGALGRLGWPVARFVVVAGVRFSFWRLGRYLRTAP
jgi:polyketide cyclase/dehydrase/lipid transport protein